MQFVLPATESGGCSLCPYLYKTAFIQTHTSLITRTHQGINISIHQQGKPERLCTALISDLLLFQLCDWVVQFI